MDDREYLTDVKCHWCKGPADSWYDFGYCHKFNCLVQHFAADIRDDPEMIDRLQDTANDQETP